MRELSTVSLFCGAGGETAGKLEAVRDLGVTASSVALNHWHLAVSTHAENFPSVDVRCEDITAVTAADFGLAGTTIDMLWASPSCVHHSRARGGKPRDAQQRAHAWEIVDRWLRVADVQLLLVENVEEFEQWGPLGADEKPIKARRGEFFHAWVQALRDLGYQVGWRVLCAADYGDPTTRRRLFVQARRDGEPIAWPEPTHRNPRKPVTMFDATLPPWRSAAECIDWTIPAPSIFERRRPLADATCRRIAHGVMRYVVEAERPFIAPVVAGGAKHALVAAFLARHYGGPRQVIGRALDEPMATVTAVDHHALVAASLVTMRGTDARQVACSGASVEAPLGTVSAGGIHHGLVAAFLTQYYGNGGATSVADPLDTVTTKDRHALVTVAVDGETYVIADIGMRMLQPRELARAMGFPESFRLPSSATAAVKMIGNACPVGTVRALVRAALATPAREAA
jgi:DNA (cytosine-5)-methyltransferase 1